MALATALRALAVTSCGGEKQLFWGRKGIGILPGQYFDEETGLNYIWQRYYNLDTDWYVLVAEWDSDEWMKSPLNKKLVDTR